MNSAPVWALWRLPFLERNSRGDAGMCPFIQVREVSTRPSCRLWLPLGLHRARRRSPPFCCPANASMGLIRALATGRPLTTRAADCRSVGRGRPQVGLITVDVTSLPRCPTPCSLIRWPSIVEYRRKRVAGTIGYEVADRALGARYDRSMSNDPLAKGRRPAQDLLRFFEPVLLIL